ncbi:MAG TPA: PaaI family thioesterase [Crocinitomicaceae bacterium]|nr:PaaI family thioesterase [Crocinitomicaceae bacterium]
MNWKTTDLTVINKLNKNTLMETLDIECVAVYDNKLEMTMPVSSKNHQPMGLLHGGASVALIESVGSLGSALLVDLQKEGVVGLEVNANHINGVKSGSVRAIAEIIHCGKRTHVWKVDIVDDETKKLVCTGRLTVMVIQK